MLNRLLKLFAIILTLLLLFYCVYSHKDNIVNKINKEKEKGRLSAISESSEIETPQIEENSSSDTNKKEASEEIAEVEENISTEQVSEKIAEVEENISTGQMSEEIAKAEENISTGQVSEEIAKVEENISKEREREIVTEDIESIENLEKLIRKKMNNIAPQSQEKIIEQKNSVEIENEEKKLDREKSEIQSKINTLLKDKTIEFKRGSSKITTKGKNSLDEIIEVINSSKQSLSLIVEGHTDSSGSAKYNKRLSQKRADSVKKYILGKTENLEVESIGYGESRPLYKDNPRDSKNRRVEILIKRIGK